MSRRAVPRGDDRGITLVELVVAMGLMSVLSVVFLGGMLQVYRSTDRTETLSARQSQIHIAFQRLDAELRYAAGISVPAQVSGDWYVEYVATHTGSQVCTQLRLTAGGLLQRRSWQRDATPSGFVALASDVTTASGGPFHRLAADQAGGTPFQRLTVRLSVTGPRAATSRAMDVTFTAMNTSPATTSDNACTEARPGG